MEMKKFAEEMKLRLEKRLCMIKEIQIQNVLRNNSVEVTALVIREQGNRIAPTIYLEKFYHAYKYGMDLEVLADEIVETYKISKMVCYPSSRQSKNKKIFLPSIMLGSFYAANNNCFS